MILLFKINARFSKVGKRVLSFLVKSDIFKVESCADRVWVIAGNFVITTPILYKISHFPFARIACLIYNTSSQIQYYPLLRSRSIIIINPSKILSSSLPSMLPTFSISKLRPQNEGCFFNLTIGLSLVSTTKYDGLNK